MGVGKVKGKEIGDTMKVGWEKKDNVGYGYGMLREGVCDGCAVGV